MKLSATSKRIAVLSLFVAGGIATGFTQKTVDSANMTSVSATLSDSRPSFSGVVDAATSADTPLQGTVVKIDNSGFSTTINQLVEGQVITIQDDLAGTNQNSYTVANTGAEDAIEFDVTTQLDAQNSGTTNGDGDLIFGPVTSSLDVTLKPVGIYPDGYFRILVPAAASNANDGNPDRGGFDFNGGTAAITCPGTAGTFTSFTASETDSSLSGITGYHTFTCDYGGTGDLTAFDSTNDFTIENLINPAIASSHTTGQADTYNIIVQHLDVNDVVKDQTTVNIGTVEAVRVTAEVPPQITFEITGGAANAGCEPDSGNSNAATENTTATTVALGELSISDFTYASQTLTVATNADDGYVVTTIANDQLGKSGVACTGDQSEFSGSTNDCIPDASGDGDAMTHLLAEDWEDVASKGFGYSIINDDAASVAFDADGYDSDNTVAWDSCTGDGITAKFCARQFPDAEATQSPVTIFSSDTVANDENVDICYAAIVSATQTANQFYENYITYTATATF